jgi:hypothetical protein
MTVMRLIDSCSTERPACIAFRGLAVCLALVVLARGLHANEQISLEQLTVPSGRLPAICVLSPAPTIRDGENRIRTGLWAGLPIDRNPWFGSDRVVTAIIRERLAPPRLPDGPPLDRAQLARFRFELAAGVERSYAAVYAASYSGSLVTAYGLEFPTEEDVDRLQVELHTSATAELFPIGRVLAIIAGPQNECRDAVIAHMRSLR